MTNVRASVLGLYNAHYKNIATEITRSSELSSNSAFQNYCRTPSVSVWIASSSSVTMSSPTHLVANFGTVPNPICIDVFQSNENFRVRVIDNSIAGGTARPRCESTKFHPTAAIC